MKVFDLHIGVSDFILDTEINVLTKHSIKGFALPNQFDILRAQEGGLDTFVGMMCPIIFRNGKAILPDNAEREIQKHIDVYRRLEDKEVVTIVKRKSDLRGKGLKVILGIEGIYLSKVAPLQRFFDQGVRVVGPMWNLDSHLFSYKNVTPLGRDIFSLCKERNIIVDLAHSENSTFEAILNTYAGAIMDSHTNSKTVYNHTRNISDEQVRCIKERGGIVGISCVGEFVGGESLKSVFSHLVYLQDTFGEDTIALGSDFDGMDFTDIISGFDDVSAYPKLASYMKANAFSKEAIQKVYFKNAYNFFTSYLPI